MSRCRGLVYFWITIMVVILHSRRSWQQTCKFAAWPDKDKANTIKSIAMDTVETTSGENLVIYNSKTVQGHLTTNTTELDKGSFLQTLTNGENQLELPANKSCKVEIISDGCVRVGSGPNLKQVPWYYTFFDSFEIQLEDESCTDEKDNACFTDVCAKVHAINFTDQLKQTQKNLFDIENIYPNEQYLNTCIEYLGNYTTSLCNKKLCNLTKFEIESLTIEDICKQGPRGNWEGLIGEICTNLICNKHESNSKTIGELCLEDSSSEEITDSHHVDNKPDPCSSSKPVDSQLSNDSDHIFEIYQHLKKQLEFHGQVCDLIEHGNCTRGENDTETVACADMNSTTRDDRFNLILNMCKTEETTQAPKKKCETIKRLRNESESCELGNMSIYQPNDTSDGNTNTVQRVGSLCGRDKSLFRQFEKGEVFYINLAHKFNDTAGEDSSFVFAFPITGSVAVNITCGEPLPPVIEGAAGLSGGWEVEPEIIIPPEDPYKANTLVWILVAVCSAMALMIFLLICCFGCYCRKSKRREKIANEKTYQHPQGSVKSSNEYNKLGGGDGDRMSEIYDEIDEKTLIQNVPSTNNAPLIAEFSKRSRNKPDDLVDNDAYESAEQVEIKSRTDKLPKNDTQASTESEKKADINMNHAPKDNPYVLQTSPQPRNTSEPSVVASQVSEQSGKDISYPGQQQAKTVPMDNDAYEMAGKIPEKSDKKTDENSKQSEGGTTEEAAGSPDELIDNDAYESADDKTRVTPKDELIDNEAYESAGDIVKPAAGNAPNSQAQQIGEEPTGNVPNSQEQQIGGEPTGNVPNSQEHEIGKEPTGKGPDEPRQSVVEMQENEVYNSD